MYGIRALGLGLLLAATAWAGDYYVDATTGSNLSGDGSRLRPWKTLTHTLGQLPLPSPAGGLCVHILPGFHESRMGEQFPLTIPAGVALVGAGPEQSVIYGDGKVGEALLEFAAGTDLRNVLSGLGLHGGDPAVRVSAAVGSGPGPVVRDCCLSWNLGAIVLEGTSPGAREPLVEQCAIQSNTNVGVRLEAAAADRLGGRIRACRFDANGGAAIELQASTGEILTVIESCALMDTGGDGVRFLAGATSQPLFTHLTVRGAAGAGFRFLSGASAAGLQIRNSIFHGNLAGDLVDVPAPAVTHCCFLTASGTNPPQAHHNGNLKIDPIFQTPGEPDLSPFSPLIDRAAVSAALDPTTDLAGRARTADGDGDSLHAPDIGALEYVPLREDSPTPMPGGLTSLDLDLPTNASIPYAIGLSLHDRGIAVAGPRTIPLWPDELLVMVVAGQLPFVTKFAGSMNASGFARAHIQWPANPKLRGLLVYAAAVTIQAGYPGGLRCVTNGLRLALL
ncbi:MAG: right-handed parallel beta-helix repeat-containing protein [Planctomycetes bacterium]|nr:right-handed parallel beta-helix repeat-containing protein [Planctomycetota bacterium]